MFENTIKFFQILTTEVKASPCFAQLPTNIPINSRQAKSKLRRILQNHKKNSKTSK